MVSLKFVLSFLQNFIYIFEEHSYWHNSVFKRISKFKGFAVIEDQR